MKIKFFRTYLPGIETELENSINNFIKDKDVIDIKMSCACDSSDKTVDDYRDTTTVLIMYKEGVK